MGFFEDRNYQLSHSRIVSLLFTTSMSGMDYRADSDRLYMVSSQTTIEGIKVVNRSGIADGSRIAPSGLTNPEGIVYLGADQFAVVSEQPVILTRFQLRPEERVMDTSLFETFAIPQIETFPSEGANSISYDLGRDLYYVAVESCQANEGGVWEVDISGTKVHARRLFYNYDAFVDTGHLSDSDLIGDSFWGGRIGQGRTLFLVTHGGAMGRKVLHIDLAGNVLSDFEHGQTGVVEGLCFDSINQDMFLLQEGHAATNFWRYGTPQPAPEARPVQLQMAMLNHGGDDAINPVMEGLGVKLVLHKHNAAETLKKAWVEVDNKVFRNIKDLAVETEAKIEFSLVAGTQLKAGTPPILNQVHVTTTNQNHVKRGVYVSSRPVTDILLDGYDACNWRKPLILPQA